MAQALRILARRAARAARGGEDGFALMELMIVLLIMAILLATAVGTYVSLRDKGEVSAAELNVREALAAAELYYAHNDTYTGMSLAELKALDAGVRLSAEPIIKADGRKFCLESTHNGRSTTAPTQPGHNTHSLIGPAGEVQVGPCPATL